MLENEKDKMLRKGNASVKEEFHFAGSGEYEPQTITAPNRDAAEQEWLKTRKPVKKVEPLQEENNESTT